MAKVYIVSFRTHDDRRPSKFIVLADNMKSAINKAWKHGGADFQSRFNKSTGQAQELKEGVLRVCDTVTRNINKIIEDMDQPVPSCQGEVLIYEC